ncbi:unnamed protein product [Cladocopium goreaui]|uniref:Uncharacterized protein n=1 Tax=Cladocopium goreaui TaxID=2562237 RepID=A0A9P1DHG8_9DINO|nr:unnamed protein product [Cladocopium goreaui]
MDGMQGCNGGIKAQVTMYNVSSALSSQQLTKRFAEFVRHLSCYPTSCESLAHAPNPTANFDCFLKHVRPSDPMGKATAGASGMTPLRTNSFCPKDDLTKLFDPVGSMTMVAAMTSTLSPTFTSSQRGSNLKSANPMAVIPQGVRRAQSDHWEDFAGESLEKVLGSDLRRAPLHWVLPMETNKWLNLEAWVPLEKLHKSAFAGSSRLRQQNRVQANEEEEEATTSITTSVSSSQSMFLEERTPVTVSLLLSPGREGKVFWNLVHGFRTEIKKELLVIHVLMPIAVDVPSSFWTSQTGATTPTNGPIPELTPYVDGILQRLRSKLGKMQAQEAKQVKGVEDHFHTEEVPLPPSPARRRASDLGPMGQTQPNLPTELLRVAMTRRISEVSLCSSLPELFELWDAGAASAMRCRALEATELRCRELARALSDVWSGIHFVPRFGSAMALPYELYYFWEEVLANESQVLMSHWKYGKKGDRSHRRELFNIEPYMILGSSWWLLLVMILDPDETDCPIAYMSQGLEDLFGYWRAWALGRNFRFLLGPKKGIQMLPDALPNRVFNGQEFSRIEDFCCNQGQKEQGSADAASHMMSLLRLYSVKSKQPIWCCLYLRHVWLQDLHSKRMARWRSPQIYGH